MDTIYDIYKKMYSLEILNLDYIKDNSISFIFIDDHDNCYLDEMLNFVSYSSLLKLKMVDLIFNIEKIYNIKVYNFFPLCFTKNKSIVVACKIKNSSSKLKIIDKKNIKEIFDIIKEESKYYSNDYDSERLLIEKYSNRYHFYLDYIKKYFLTEKRKRKSSYLKLINDLITDEVESIIDVSCGDNEDIFKSYKDIELVVGNDINLYHIKVAQNKYRNLIFTNNNILNLKYKKNFFDVSYCKNTLHHFNNKDEIQTALINLLKISKRIIVVETEDPKIVGGLPNYLNKYLYKKYLKDAGKEFLNFKTFKEIIDKCYLDSCNISYLTFENILGKYMIAYIEKR